MRGDLRRYAAANARVRTLLATLLGRSGLEALYSYPTLTTLLDALARTPYGAAMIPDYTPESAVRARLAAVGRAVLQLLPPPERLILHQYLLHHEVDNLKIVIRCVARHYSWPQVAPSVVPLPGIATVDLQALAGAHDVRELVGRLAGTAYGLALRGAVHRLEEAGSFALEVALELDYYERLWLAASKLQAPDAVRAQQLLGIVFDVLNIQWIARYRDAHGLPPEEILNYTLRQGRWLTLDIRRKLARDATLPWHVALAGTPYAPALEGALEHGFDVVSPALWRVLAVNVQHCLSGYPFHIAVPLAFLLAQDIEIRDLQVLLAAKSIGAPAAEVLEQVASVRH